MREFLSCRRLDHWPRFAVATALMLFACSPASLMAISLPGVSWSSVYEFTSGSYLDESGNANTLSAITGSPSFAVGRNGASSSAIQGSAGTILGRTSPLVSFNPSSNQLTLSAWIKSTSSGNELIATMGRSPSSIEGEWLWGISNGRLYFWDYQGGGHGFPATFTSTTTINNGQWRHVAFVRNGLTGTFYVDGIPAGSMTAAKNISYTNSDMMIGGDYRDKTLSSYWTGQLDDVSVSSGALTAAQILLLAADASVPGVETGPTNSISGLTQTSVKLMGGITNLGGTTVTNAGFYLNTNSPATNGVKYSAPGTSFGLGSFSNTITGLTPGTSYYYRAFAANSVGTGYGANEYSFTTHPLSPFTYTTSSGEVTITGYTGTGGNVEIPATIGGVAVTTIGDHAFERNSSLSAVIIPNGVTTVGDFAFAGCNTMTSVTLPASLASIGNYAFQGCGNLGSVLIPDGVTSLGANAFESCSGLTSITLSNTLRNIGSGAFFFCTNLASITIPDSVLEIGENAFWNCHKLKSATIGNGVTALPRNAFSECLDLTSVSLGANVKTLGDYAFNNCAKLMSITFPAGLESIGTSAFALCADLTTITLPESVGAIGVRAFKQCSKLTTVNFEENMSPTFGAEAFSGIASGAVGYYPATASAAWQGVTIAGLTLTPFGQVNRAPVITGQSTTYDALAEFVAGPTQQSANSRWQYLGGNVSALALLGNWKTTGNEIIQNQSQWDGNSGYLSNYPFVQRVNSASGPTSANTLVIHPSNLEEANRAVAIGWKNTSGQTVAANFNVNLRLPYGSANGIDYKLQRGLAGSSRYLSIRSGSLQAGGSVALASDSLLEMQAGEMLYLIVDSKNNFDYDHTEVSAFTVTVAGGANLDSISQGVASASNSGTAVTVLTEGSSDADSDALKGVAVTGVDTSHGDWEYTVDGGNIWNSLNGVSLNTARLLKSDAQHRVRFVPNANFSGNAEIQYQAWDQTSGEDGALADLTAVGGGAWVLVAYGANASLGGFLTAPSGSFSSSARIGSAVMPGSLDILKNSMELAMTWTASGGSFPSGGIGSYAHGIAFALPNAAGMSFDGSASTPLIYNNGANPLNSSFAVGSSNPDQSLVNVRTLVGSPGMPSQMYLRNKTFGAGYGSVYGVVMNNGSNAQLDYNQMPDSQTFKAVYLDHGTGAAQGQGLVMGGSGGASNSYVPSTMALWARLDPLQVLALNGGNPVSTSGNYLLDGISTSYVDVIDFDASGAFSAETATGTIHVLDTSVPVITLIGANPLEIYKGATFSDPGATVTDNVDATGTIMGSGTVNTATVGNYTLNYNATDVAGNQAVQVTRTVNVVLDPTIDTDGDGLTDAQEIALGSNPNIVDTDGDTLLDGAEVALGTNPTNPDTDGDKVPDGVEATNGTSPLNPASNPLPAITTQLLGGTKNQGDSWTFTVNATDPTATFIVYQWKKNGVNLGGGTFNNFLTISSLQLSDAGNYEVIVSNPLGSTTSSVVTLVVNPRLVVPATITLSPAAGSYTLLQGAVPLDDSLTVSGDETFSGATIQIETGFAVGDMLNLTQSIGGITGIYDGTKGILTLSGSGSASEYQSALRAVTFSTASASTVARGFKVTLGSAISFGGHYYEYVPGSYSWAEARTLALSKTFNGLSGYLANLTSADENSFVKTKIGTDVWIGGSDEGTEGVWKWMDGPEAGITFWNGLSTGSAPSGKYANWNAGEPNDAGNEDYAQFYVATAKWNDLPSGSRLGFLVEYGTDTPVIQTFSGTRIFSVTKATPSITAVPTAAPIAYGQTLGSSTLSGGSGSVAGSFAFANPSATPAAGTSSLNVIFTPTDNARYETVTTSVSVTVNKATPTITALPGFMSATGGTKSGSGDFIIHTFTNVGNSTFKPTGSGTVEILVVAGGGGAGYDGGGGGGAGGVITNTVSVTAGTDYTVVVGGGGAAAIGPTWEANGYPGSNSQFGSITAIGGAGGYNGHAGITAITTGGSGGGEGFNGGGPGNGTPGQGNRGGYKSMDSAGGGGGGAGEVGGNASIGKGGNGGNGIQSDISGVATWYGGGGAGGSWNGTGGTGGMGGGGNGGGDRPATAGANGIANTGGGGGGNGYASSSDSGMGGSGIVIVRYKPKVLTYGQSIGEVTFSGATASVPGTFAFANPLATPAAGNNSLSVIFTPTDAVNYNTTTTSVNVKVNKATPSITSVPTTTPISYGQTLAFSTLSGGVASVPGSFAWADSAAAPETGTTIQNVIFTPEDRANYNELTIPLNVTVNQALISSGFSHTLYLGAGDSTVTAWGLNTDGRLGVGDMNSPVNWAKAVQGIPVGVTVDALSAGGTHSLILAGGEVYAAGSDRFGQLGQGAVNGANKTSFTPVAIPSSTPVAVAAGGNHSLIVTASGKVFACGDNTYGQLARSSTTVSSGTLVEVNFPGLSTKIVSVAAGADHNLAVDEDGGVWVWGRNNYGQLGKGNRSVAERTPSELNLGDGVFAESVAAGFSHSLILTTDGEVLGFGRNNSGQTGQVATTSVVTAPSPIYKGLIELSEIRSISAGTDSSFAITESGQLYSWGYNAYGELLLGYASPVSSPAVYGPKPSPICTNVFNVSGGGYSSLAVGAQGVIFGGRNDVGQAGNGPDPEQVVGDYFYEAGDLTLGNLTMDLAGNTETLYDQVFVGNGAVTLNGILNLMFVGTYSGPVYGSTQTFDLIWAKNGITLVTGYELAFNQAGYLVESAVVDKSVEGVSGKVLQATVRAVVTAGDLAKAVDLARPSLDGVESVSYGGSSGVGIRTLSVSSGVEMIYSYERPTGGVSSGAEYFVEGTTYRVDYDSSLSGSWVSASVSGTTITPLGNGRERVTLRISSSGGAGFLRLQVENPQATGINAGVGSAITY